MPDLVDECAVQLLKELDGKKVVFTNERWGWILLTMRSKSAEDLKGALEQVITFMKDVLGHKVESVSGTEHVCCQFAERSARLDLCTSSRP